MSDIKVDYVEIGFRSYEKNFRGSCAYSTDEFLDNLQILKFKNCCDDKWLRLIKKEFLKK